MKIVLPVIALVVGVFMGVAMEKANPTFEDPHGHGAHDEHAQHELRNVEGVAPSVDLILHEVSEGEFVAQILTTNFRLSPLGVSGEDVSGEGHAHIYVDGEKKNRVLGEWYNLGKLSEGDREISVRLSSNDHFELAVDGEIIADTEIAHVGHGEHDDHDDHHDAEDVHLHNDEDDHTHDE